MPPMVLHKCTNIIKKDESRLTDIMEVGNVFTIEPIFLWHPITRMNMWKDHFTIICPDNPNAQFEHTILIVENGCEVLTVRKNETIPNPNGNIKNLL
jgi:methionyl aminopeptidase